MSNVMYFPVLKWKTGEQDALKELTPDSTKMIPVLELACDDDDDIPTPEVFFSTVAECYDGPFYFDTIQCDDDQRELLKSYIKYASDSNISAWPMLYLEDLSETLSKTQNKITRFALDIPVPEDFEAGSTQKVLTHLKDLTSSIKIDLFFDANLVLENSDARIILFAYKQLLLENNELLSNFNKVVICLSSFPKDLKGQPGETTRYIRYDILTFDYLLRHCPPEMKEILAYADYGVSKFTDTQLEPYMFPRILPKIKYTTYKDYIVYKGAKDRITRETTYSHIDMAKVLVQTPDYQQFGKDFCFGDSKIYEKAYVADIGPGNNRQWVTYCVNHHITVLLEQLSNPDDVLKQNGQNH